MRVLLAGASGAIGRQLVPQLLAAGHEVCGLSRTRRSAHYPEVSEITVDVLHREAVLEAVKGRSFDAVIHQLTALAKAPTHYSSMLRTNRLRSEATSTLIAVARATGAQRVVTASVFYGYGFLDHGPEPITEHEPFGFAVSPALDPVQRALLSNEQQVLAFGGIALRYGLFYGVGPSSVAASDWSGQLPLIHISDAATAAVCALTQGTPGEAYNIAEADTATWLDLQQAQAIALGRPLPLALPSWLLRATAPFAAELITRTSMRLSNEKARRELGWSPRFADFTEGLRSQVSLATAH